MDINCIFCRERKKSSKEHVLPESIGGNLTVNSVCIECNSFLGHKVDGPFVNQLIMSLPRYATAVSDSVRELHKDGITKDDVKIRLNNDQTPRIIPTIINTKTKTGEYEVSITVDKKDKDKLESIIKGQLKSILKKSGEEIDEEKLQNEAKKLLSKSKTVTKNEEIILSFELDLNTIVFEFYKITYELASELFGEDYVESETAKNIRDSVLNLDKSIPIHGQIPLADDQLAPLFPNNSKHYVLLIESNCYIKLFGIAGIMKFDETNTFFLNQESAILYEFDPKSKNHKRMRFIDYLEELNQNVT